MKHLISIILKKALLGFSMLGVCGFFSCEETLPPRDLRDFLSPVFRAVEKADVFFAVMGDTIIYGTGAFFSVGLKNHSDEHLQAKARIQGTLEILSPTDPSFRRVFDFEVPHFNVVTINPLSEFTVSVIWDQRDQDCRYVFRDLDLEVVTIGRTIWWRTVQPLTFRAKGKVQFWPNVQTKDLPEAIFQRVYYFSFDPRLSFQNSRSCRQFPSLSQ